MESRKQLLEPEQDYLHLCEPIPLMDPPREIDPQQSVIRKAGLRMWNGLARAYSAVDAMAEGCARALSLDGVKHTDVMVESRRIKSGRD